MRSNSTRREAIQNLKDWLSALQLQTDQWLEQVMTCAPRISGPSFSKEKRRMFDVANILLSAGGSSMPRRHLIFARHCFLARAMPSTAPSLSVGTRCSCQRAEAVIKAGGRQLAYKEGHRHGDSVTTFPGVTVQIGGGCHRGSPLPTHSPLGAPHVQLVPATRGTL